MDKTERIKELRRRVREITEERSDLLKARRTCQMMILRLKDEDK